MVVKSKSTLITAGLKEGCTTGTCAAAAAAAATEMLLTGKVIDKVEVELPDGNLVSLGLVDQKIGNGKASCGVIKDAGDDPDVTHGMKIYADAEPDSNGVTILAGEGVGMVTKPGLSVPVGEPAINPVPRSMIKNSVLSVLMNPKSGAPKENTGIRITIYAPEGVEKAERTLNKKLGIVGGISILGTTGIVRPMSLESLKASLFLQVGIARALGYETVVLVPGNMGEKVARDKLGFPEDAVIQMSNFVGDLLNCCVENKIERILLLGHVGKIVKVASGYFETHSNKTDEPVILLRGLIKEHVKGHDKVVSLMKTVNTAEEAAIELLNTNNVHLLTMIAERASRQARDYTNHRIEIGTSITVLSGDVVAMDEAAKQIIGDGL